MCSSDIFLGLLAILFPPLPVWVKRGLCSADSIINILLCVLGFIPGLIHAWYIIAKFPEEYESYEPVPQDDGGERGNDGRVTYVFVQQDGHSSRQPVGPHGGMNYGATTDANKNNQNSSSAAQPPHDTGNGEGGSNGAPAPPTYAQAVQGDNKVQTHD